jgi:uncharacterized membrane protein YheB (UPF0754 family)
MEIFLTILRYAAGPVLGAVIGYFTNWLAVKMLFRPYYPIKIGKHTLPFTPGIIPKRKGELAKAVGKAVGETLFTGDDMVNALCGDDAKRRVEDIAVDMFASASDESLGDMLNSFGGDDTKDKIQNFVTDRVYSAVQKLDLGQMVADESARVVVQKKSSLGMVAMFLSDDLIYSITGKLKDGVNSYVEDNGRSLIGSAVGEEIDGLAQKPVSSLSGVIGEDMIRSAAGKVYDKVIKGVLSSLASRVDIGGIVEQKINEMDVKDLEKLVLSVMKKELRAIVNLGALIGFILGIVMIFV